MIFSSVQGLATHIRGGQITIRKVSGLTYQITLRGFANLISPVKWGGGTLDFGDGSTIISPPPDGIYEPTYDPLMGIYLFTVAHTYSGPGFYRVTYNEQNLSEGIINMANSVDTPFFVESEFLIDPLVKFSTMSFGCDPIFNFLLGESFSFSTAPVDTMSNIYNYELVVPEQAAGVPVLNYIFPGSIQVNAQSGLVTWDTRFQQQGYLAGEYLFAVKVTQFDVKGNYLGYVTRVFATIVQEIPSIISISNPITDPIGKVTVLPGNQRKIKVILSDSISVDSLLWSAYFDPALANNISFSQYDSTSPARKFKIGLLALSSATAIARSLPYSIILRGVSYVASNTLAKDISFFLFTKEVDLPVITGVTVSDQEVSVYPNPCTNELHIAGGVDNGNVKIVSSLGQLVTSSAIDSRMEIDTSLLSPGIYFLILNSNNGTSRFKVVKK